MTENQTRTTEDNQLISEEEEPREEGSDAESLDSEGYSKHDPYAAQAKRIDRERRARQELESSRVHQMSKAVIDNRENITFFEQHLKRIIVFAVLVCLVAGNADKLYEDYNKLDYSKGGI